MASFPIAASAFAGFGVVRRQPLAVLAWGVLLFVMTVLPTFGVFALIAPGFEDLIQAIIADTENHSSFEQIMALQARMMALNPLMMLLSVAVRVLLVCAIFRAVLRPDESRWAYLRLGRTELMVGLAFVCLMIMLFVLLFIGVGLVGATVVIASMTAESTATALAFGGAMLLMVGFIWLGLRFSMALPMTFEQGEFRLFESWAATRGRTGRLFLVGLVVTLVILLVEIVVGAIGFGIGFAVLTSQPLEEDAFLTFFSRPLHVWAFELAPWAMGVGFVASLVGAFLSTLATAPWAAVWRDLAHTPPEIPPATGEWPSPSDAKQA